MNPRAANLCLIGAFLVILGTVPLVQTVVEARRGEWPLVTQVFRQWPDRESLAACERSVEEASVVARALRPWMQAAQFLVLRDGGAKAVVATNGSLFYAPGVNTLTQRPQRGESTAGDAVRAAVAFRDALRERGIRLLVLPVPNKESIYPDWLNQAAARPTRVINPVTRDFLAGCREAGVEVVNLFAVYSMERGSNPEPLYLGQDSHWSPAGIEFAARAVAERIGNRGSVRFASRPVPLDVHGDLVRMLRSPVLESRIAPERVETIQVIGANDPDAASVLVLGDSFSRIFQTDAPRDAGFIAHLARHLGQPVASLVNDGGGATLVRQELHRRPELLAGRKTVVWEFTERDLQLAAEGWQIIDF